MSVINFAFPGLHDVPEIFDFGCKQYAFIYLENDTRTFQICQSISSLVNTVFDTVRVDEYILEIVEARFLLIFSAYDVEDPLKGCSGVW